MRNTKYVSFDVLTTVSSLHKTITTVLLPSRKATVLAILLCLSPLGMLAQATQLGFSNSPPSFGHGHDYIQLLNETVNPADGSLTLKIDIPTPSGRGLNFPYALTYNSSIMHSFSQVQGYFGVPAFIQPASLANNFNTFGGWSDTLPKLVVEHTPYAEVSSMPPDADQYTTLIICESWQGLQFTDLSGQTHQPNIAAGNSYVSGGCTGPLIGARDTGFDATVQAHADASGVSEFATNDGTYYLFSMGSGLPAGVVTIFPQLIEDKNGNKLTVRNGNYTSNVPFGPCSSSCFDTSVSVADTLGRTVIRLQPVDTSHELIQVSGISKPYSINFSSIPLLTGIHTPQSSIILGGGPALQTGSTMDTMNAFPAGTGGGLGLTSLALPDGGSYSFSYESLFGNISKITYPNGGYVSYTWGFPGGYSDDANYSGQYVSCPTGACPGPTEFWTTFRVYIQYAMPVILHREVSFDGNTIALTQDFSYQTTFRQGDMMGGWMAKTTTVTTNDLIAGTSSAVTYSYSPFTPYGQNPSQRYTGQQAQEYQTVYKDGSGNVLQTVCKTWIDNVDLLHTQKTILANGMVSEHDYDYAFAGASAAPTGGDDYGFSAPQSNPSCLSPSSPNFLSGSPTPGPLITSTHQISNSVSNASTTSGVSLYPYAPSILDTPGSTVTKDGSGNIIAETDYQYTNAVSQTVSGVVQHDAAYDNGSKVRQNLLSVTKQCFPSCLAETETYKYDNTGQVVSATDGRNYTTNYSYADAYTADAGQPTGTTNAYPTLVQAPPTNGVQHIQSATYGYNDGKIRSIKDENAKVTTYCYATAGCLESSNDPWMRLTQILYPDGGSRSAGYNDAGSSPTITSTTVMSASASVSKTTVGDGMGHVIQTQLTSDPFGTVYQDTTYTGLGQVNTVSNSYRTQGDNTYGITSYTYDAMSRIITKRNSDGTVHKWCYNGVAGAVGNNLPCYGNLSSVTGSWVDTVDESGNHTQTVSDALGRLTAVMEPGTAFSSSALETDYLYDALGNLTTASQKGTSGEVARNRIFMYNSLSDLITSSNPETGTICYGQWSGTSCSGGYDANGNLIYKTDARGVTVQYQYDALNRLLSETGPGINYVYAYDDPSVVPNPMAATNTVGRLVWQTNGVDSDAHYSYDAMGRVVAQSGCTPQSCAAGTNPVSASYDLAGNMTSLMYPDGRTISQGFDAAGRMNSVGYTSWGTNAVTAPSYLTVNNFDPAGHVTNATMGNGIALNAAYDNRLRINGLSYANATSPLWYKNYTWTPNSNLQTAVDNIQGVTRQFGYDSLNRLISAQDVISNPFAAGSTPASVTQSESNVPQSGWVVYGGTYGTVQDTLPNGGGQGTVGVIAATAGSPVVAPVDGMSYAPPYSQAPVVVSLWLRVTSGTLATSLFVYDAASLLSGQWQYTYPASEPVTLTTNWQLFQLQAMDKSSLDQMGIQLGANNITLASGQQIEVYGANISTSLGQQTNSTDEIQNNLLKSAGEIGGPGWVTYGGLMTGNADVAPDGSQTAGVVTATPGNPVLILDTVSQPSLYSGANVTASVWMRVTSGTLTSSFYLWNQAGTNYLTTEPAQQEAYLTTQWQQFQVTGNLPNSLDLAGLAIGNGNNTALQSGQALEIWGATLQTSSNGVTTNILPSSQQIDGVSWEVSTGATPGVITSNTTLAPDSSNTATTLLEPVGVYNMWIADTVANPAQYSGQTVTGSVYLCSPSGNVTLPVLIINVGANGYSIVNQTMVTLTPVWQRVQVTGTNQPGLGLLQLQIGGGGNWPAGQSVSVWGAQMTTGSSEGNYVPTQQLATTPTGQPVALAASGLNESYSYDSFGNIAQAGTFQFDQGYTADNRLAGFPYDAAGNLLGDRLTNVMTYDANERIATLNGTGYSYLPSGERAGKTGAGATDYVYFGGRQIARYSGGQWTDLIYGPSGLLAEVPGTQNGSPVYRMLDHLGTEVGTLDAAGNQLSSADYAPFGQLFSGGDGDPYKFTGKERDAESGLDYFGARYYGSSMGRMMSPDPLMASAKVWDPQTWNRYAYARNNPLTYIDPTGMAEVNAAACAKDSNCVTVNVNVIYDKNANGGKGLTDSQKAGFEKNQLQNAKDQYGNADIHLNVTYTAGAMSTSDGKTMVSGLQAGALNVMVTDQVNGAVSGMSGKTAISFINANSTNNEDLPHEMAHQFMGDTQGLMNRIAHGDPSHISGLIFNMLTDIGNDSERMWMNHLDQHSGPMSYYPLGSAFHHNAAVFQRSIQPTTKPQ